MILSIGRSKGRLPLIKPTLFGFTPLEIPFLTGFTLTELLLSLVILSFGLVAIIGSYLTATNALNASQNRLRAVELLQKKFALLKQKVIEQNGLDAVTFSEPAVLNNRPAVYSEETSALNNSPGLDLSQELNLVKLSLAWKERNIDKDVSILTYLEKRP